MNQRHVVAIVQARMTSQRLPGKSLALVGGIPVAELVLRRLARARRLDLVVLATSSAKDDDALAVAVEAAGFPVVRGSENDLIRRFYDAARAHQATEIVRVCADNVFVDPLEIDRLIEHGQETGADFVGFVNPKYPERNNDFGGEYVRFRVLERAEREATTPNEREHLFPWFYAHEGQIDVRRLEVHPSLWTAVKLDLDYAEDLQRLRAVADTLGDPVRAASADVVRMASALFGDRHKGYEFNLVPRAVPKVETKYRRIVTELPVPESLDVLARIRRYEGGQTSTQLPIVWDRASGFRVFDRWGNAWIDFTSSIFVTNAGHSHPHVVRAIQEHAANMLHSYYYATEIRAAYLEKLIAFTPPYLEKASLFSSGTEASERAIKLARIYGQTFAPVRKLIVGGEGNFHGKTMGAQMAGGQDAGKRWIGYRDPNMVQMPFPYPWVMDRSRCSGDELFARHLAELERAGHDPRTAVAFIIEPVQGWGAIFYPEDYVQAMARFCREHRVLLIVDEIQAGFGRTGKLFSYEHYGVEPDLVICGKGISGSLPLSAVLGRAPYLDLDETYTSTHGGNPLACAAGLANIEVLEREQLVEQAACREAIFLAEIERWRRRFPAHVGRVCGRGMLFGVFITRSGEGEAADRLDFDLTDRVIERALEKGVFSIHTGRGTIKLGPPLGIPEDALVEGMRVYEESLAEVIAETGRR